MSPPPGRMHGMAFGEALGVSRLLCFVATYSWIYKPHIK